MLSVYFECVSKQMHKFYMMHTQSVFIFSKKMYYCNLHKKYHRINDPHTPSFRVYVNRFAVVVSDLLLCVIFVLLLIHKSKSRLSYTSSIRFETLLFAVYVLISISYCYLMEYIQTHLNTEPIQ